jgi:3-phenylpropionate/trans-cinnamate dioxygenase ferredoxin component
MAETATFVRLAAVADVPAGCLRVFEIGGARVAVCNLDGEFRALDDRCTHDNGPLGEGELFDGEIECPRHGARFDARTGKALCLPAVGAVATYVLEVRGEELWIKL